MEFGLIGKPFDAVTRTTVPITAERKNIADIIVAKHRNGPVGEVSLFFQASQKP